MRRLSCRIEIERKWTTEEGANLSRRWKVERVAGVKITGDTSSLQDTCVVSLARNTKWAGHERIPVRRGDPDTAAEMAASDAKPATDGTPRRDRIVPMPYMCLLRGFFVPSFESLQHPENQKYPQNTIKNKQLSEYQSLTK